MSAGTAASPLVIPTSERMLLSGVSWLEYEAALAEFWERRSPRFTYDRGWLETAPTSGLHEFVTETLAAVVDFVAVEEDRPYWKLGSTTFKRADIAQGFEPDSCFFFSREPAIRKDIEFHPETDPPPDLVIDVDLSSSSLDRFPIYAGFGVAEVWRYHDGVVTIWQLVSGRYVPAESSQWLPIVDGRSLTRLVAETNASESRGRWARMIKQWVQERSEAAE